MAYYNPTWKSGGHVPRVPHQIAPMQPIMTVTVRVDCNTSSAPQEEELSDCDSDEHSITDLGYNVVEDDERFGEGPLDYVYHD